MEIGLNDMYSFNKTHAPTGFDLTIQHLEKTSLQGIRGSTVQITLRKKPSGMKNGRLFCVDRRKGGNLLIKD